MRQLSMIEEMTSSSEIGWHEHELIALLEKYGKALFYAQMQYHKARRHAIKKDALDWQYKIHLARNGIAHAQNQLYDLAPDRYPQFGALG